MLENYTLRTIDMEETEKKTTNSPATSEAQPSAAQPATAKKRNMLPLLVVLLILLIGGGVTLYTLFFDSPAKIKEKVKVSHPVFLSYVRLVEKVADHLKEEADSDADSIERYGAKGEDLLKDVRDEKGNLTTEMSGMNSGKLKKYKDALQAYVTKSDELYKLEENNVTFSQAYVEPLRKYEKLTIDVQGASSYLYSDPDKYVSILNKAIADEKSVIRDLKKLSLEGDMGLMHEAFIATMETEVTFLEDMVKAVEDRDSSTIATATQKYAQEQQKNTKELKRVSDKLDNLVEDLSDDLDGLRDKVEDEYNNLKDEYNI